MKNSVMNFIRTFNTENRTSEFDPHDNWFTEFDYFRFNENGSFTCKASADYMFENEHGDHSLILTLYNTIGMNFLLAGENAYAITDMYTPFYNYDTEMIYLVFFTDSDRFMKGEEVTIYGYTPTAEELEEVEKFNNNL